MQTSHKLRGRAVRHLLHLDQVGTQGRLALAHSVDGKHAELVVGVGGEVGGSEGGVSDVVVVQPVPAARRLPALNDVTGNLGSSIMDGRRPFQINVDLADIRGEWRSRWAWWVSLNDIIKIYLTQKCFMFSPSVADGPGLMRQIPSAPLQWT